MLDKDYNPVVAFEGDLFLNFEAAIDELEEEYGFSGESWAYVIQSEDWDDLVEFLEDDGMEVVRYPTIYMDIMDNGFGQSIQRINRFITPDGILEIQDDNDYIDFSDLKPYEGQIGFIVNLWQGQATVDKIRINNVKEDIVDVDYLSMNVEVDKVRL